MAINHQNDVLFDLIRASETKVATYHQWLEGLYTTEKQAKRLKNSPGPRLTDNYIVKVHITS